MPNIVLISLDTTRADHLSCYGHTRETSRNLDAIAEESVFFTRAVSTSSWTLPAHASMFTGKFVTTHGARKDAAGDVVLRDAFEYGGDSVYHVRTVTKEEELLAESLKFLGYTTGSVVAGPWLKKKFGLAKGFDFHDDSGIYSIEGKKKKIGPIVTASANRWLDSVAGKPFFLFLNYFDPHTPYVFTRDTEFLFMEPGEELSEEERGRRDYDAQIYMMDHAIGKLVDKLKALGQYDNSMIIVVSDHGELLGERDSFGHGFNLYQPTQHVPFFIKYPLGEIAPNVRDNWIQPTEIVPTVLQRLNRPIPEYVQGSPVDNVQHPILAEVYPSEEESAAGFWQALYEGRYKLLLNSKGNHELYNLAGDPNEAKNLYTTDADRGQAMTAKLMKLLASVPKPQGTTVPLPMDPQTTQELEALGYL